MWILCAEKVSFGVFEQIFEVLTMKCMCCDKKFDAPRRELFCSEECGRKFASRWSKAEDKRLGMSGPLEKPKGYKLPGEAKKRTEGDAAPGIIESGTPHR